MKDLSWKIFFTTAVVIVALVQEKPAVMWALCLLTIVEMCEN